MRTALAAVLMLATLPASAAEEPTAGHVAGGPFGMGGSDYFGEVHQRVPFSGGWAERPFGAVDVERARAARRGEASRARHKVEAAGVGQRSRIGGRPQNGS